MEKNKNLSSFEKYLQETIDEGVQYLRSHGWLDEMSEGPDVSRIPCLKETPEVRLPVEVKVAVHRVLWNAPAHEYRGNLAVASKWYELGQFEWCGNRTFPGMTAEIPELGVREALAIQQLPAAICTDRVGNTQRARELYGWASSNYMLSGDEIQRYTDTRQLQPIWEVLPMRAYALICLESYAEGLEVARTAEYWSKKDRRAQTSEAYQVQLQLIPVLIALARYGIEPSAENRQAALTKLSLNTVGGRNHSERLICYFYWYNLQKIFGWRLQNEK